MGKGIIIENLGEAKYEIKRKYKSDYNKIVTDLEAKIDKIDKKITELNTQKNTLRNEINNLQNQLNILLSEVPINTQKVNELMAKIGGAIAGHEKAKELIGREEIKKLGVEKQIEKVKKLQKDAEQVVQVWCTTYSDELTGNIDTIEIDDQGDMMLIAPEGKTEVDGLLKHTLIGSPSETFYNAAMLPGVQKWRPRYKGGKILTVDRKKNTCSVKLMETSHTGRDTLIKDILSGIPIEYMKCNAAVFESGDLVVIEFKNRNVEEPQVIGFMNDPKPCLPLLLVQVRVAGYDDYVMIWNMTINDYYDLPHEPPITFPCKSSKIADYLDKITEIGNDLFSVEDAGFAIEDWEGHDYDCHIDTPSNQACHKETQVACPTPGHDGISGLINIRNVHHIGAYALNRYDEVHYIYDVIPLARRRDVQPLNLSYEKKLYKIYDVPFPTKKLTALNQSGYIGSAGTKFYTAQLMGDPPEEQLYPWVLQYRNYYGYERYDEWVTKQYRVLTPLGLMYEDELASQWTEYSGGDEEYSVKTFGKVQGIAGGQFADTIFTQFCLMQYVKKVTEKTRTGNEAITYSDRVITVQAQTEIGSGGLEMSPYNDLGCNAGLETAILDLVGAWYTGNGLSIKTLENIDIDWKLIS